MTGAAQCRRVGLARGLHGSEAVLPLGIVTVASIALAVVAHVAVIGRENRQHDPSARAATRLRTGDHERVVPVPRVRCVPLWSRRAAMHPGWSMI